MLFGRSLVRYGLRRWVLTAAMLLTALGAWASGPDRRAEGQRKIKQATELLDRADYNRAKPLLEEVIELGKACGDDAIIAQSKAMLGQTLALTDDAERGLILLSEALELASALPDNTVRILVYNGYGVYYITARGNPYLAKEYFLKAVKLAAADGNTRLMRRFETNIVQAGIIGRDTTVTRHAREIYEWAGTSGDIYTRYVATYQLAQLMIFAGQLDQAMRYIEEAEQTNAKIQGGDVLTVLLSKATIQQRTGDYRAAAATLDTALVRVNAGNEAVYYKPIVYSHFTELLLAQDRFSEAKSYAEKALASSLELHELTNLRSIYRQLSMSCELMGDSSGALRYARLYEAAQDSSFNAQREYIIGDLSTSYRVEQKERQIASGRERLRRERQRNVYLSVCIALLLLLAITLVSAYVNKSRLHKKVVSLYREAVERENALRHAAEAGRQAAAAEVAAESPAAGEAAADPSRTEVTRTAATIERIWQRLLTLMTDEELWRNPDIDRDSVARSLDTNRTYLSTAISDNTGLSFSQFVNQYRVRFAIGVLSDKSQRDYPIKALAADIGFNSVNAFYSNFKAVTGMSPASFRANA